MPTEGRDVEATQQALSPLRGEVGERVRASGLDARERDPRISHVRAAPIEGAPDPLPKPLPRKGGGAKCPLLPPGPGEPAAPFVDRTLSQGATLTLEGPPANYLAKRAPPRPRRAGPAVRRPHRRVWPRSSRPAASVVTLAVARHLRPRRAPPDHLAPFAPTIKRGKDRMVVPLAWLSKGDGARRRPPGPGDDPPDRRGPPQLDSLPRPRRRSGRAVRTDSPSPSSPSREARRLASRLARRAHPYFADEAGGEPLFTVARPGPAGS